MIRSIEIKGFRGIREGQLTDLTPLVVLVGPNGSGKSTVLEAILIGASPLPAEAIIQVIRRHEAGGSGPRWLLWKEGEAEPTEITVRADGKERSCKLSLNRNVAEDETELDFTISEGISIKGSGSVRAVKNRIQDSHSSGFLPLDGLREINLVEPYPTPLQKPLHDLYSRAVKHGRRSAAKEIIAEVFPAVTNVENLTEYGAPILHLVFEDHSVPASLAGDGIQSLLRLSLELAATGGGVALVEEPEVHQHPGAVWQSARAILAAVRRDIQVMLTTHNLELIDALLAEASSADLEKMSVYQMGLQKGILKSNRIVGSDVAFLRSDIQDDLR